MFVRVWRVALGLVYRRAMGPARRAGKVHPVPRERVLDEHAGEWVAVKDGRVIAHSPSSREVVRQMRLLGAAADGAILQRASTETEALAVGLG